MEYFGLQETRALTLLTLEEISGYLSLGNSYEGADVGFPKRRRIGDGLVANSNADGEP